MSAIATKVVLATIDDVIAQYRGVTRRMVRAWIHAGKLPASKVGRAYLVDPEDVARLLAPTLRVAPTARGRESETARLERQLAAAGVVISK